MTPGDKLRLLRRIEDCLRESPVGESLQKHWADFLFDKHRENPERSVQVCTTVQWSIVKTVTCWLTLEQGGGGFRIHIWVPQEPGNPRRWEKEARDLSDYLLSVLPTSCIQVRFTTPYDFLSRKGWSVARV